VEVKGENMAPAYMNINSSDLTAAQIADMESTAKNFGLDPANFIANSSFADSVQKFISYKKDIEIKENRLGSDKKTLQHPKPFPEGTKRMITGKEVDMNDFVMRDIPRLLVSKDSYELFENNIRGGLCNAVKHYSKANNKYIPGFNPGKIKKKYNHKTKKYEKMHLS
jgi:hypothetical protein